MKIATFKEWDLDKLDQVFGLKQVFDDDYPLLKSWQQTEVGMTEIEKKILLDLQQPLIWGGKSWNEVELENKFISPVMMTAKIDDGQIGYFLERPLAGVVGDYQLSGLVDGIIATGVRNPHIPYFCLHEYKRSIENQGTPDAQVLAAMLVAREKNNQPTIRGLYVVGLTWNFIVLKDNEYCVSKDYKTDSKDLFAIFKMLKTLKIMIKQHLNSSHIL